MLFLSQVQHPTFINYKNYNIEEAKMKPKWPTIGWGF
jgi:hypothetical protein